MSNDSATVAITFKVGMMVRVTGNDTHTDVGEGPYEVVKVELVPHYNCDCGAEWLKLSDDDDDVPHDERCSANEWRHVGHHQFVTFRTPEGDMRFSGFWLIPVS